MAKIPNQKISFLIEQLKFSPRYKLSLLIFDSMISVINIVYV